VNGGPFGQARCLRDGVPGTGVGYCYRPRRKPRVRMRSTDIGRGREGKPYDGANAYVMHFDKGQMPPVDGFGRCHVRRRLFFVANKLNRYTLSSRNKLR